MKTEQELFDDMKQNGASVFFPIAKPYQAKDFIYLTNEGEFLHTNLKSSKPPYVMDIDFDCDCDIELEMIMDEIDKMDELLGLEASDDLIEDFWQKSQFTLYTPFDRSENHMIFSLDGDMFYHNSEEQDTFKLIVDRG